MDTKLRLHHMGKIFITVKLIIFAAINFHVFPLDCHFAVINVRVCHSSLIRYNEPNKFLWRFIFAKYQPREFCENKSLTKLNSFTVFNLSR